jgi:hypothetical protein
MAKANKVRAQAPSRSPLIIGSGGDGHDIDARQLENVPGASRKDVTYKSESEAGLEATAEATAENAELVGEAWKARVAKEGVVYYACPICKGAEQAFKGKPAVAKKACEAHIKKEHSMRVKELKLTKAPKELYQPKKKVESPKRTMADAVHPKYRAQVEASMRMREALKPLSDHANRISTGNSNSIMKLVSMTESIAVTKLGTLSDKDLVQVAQIAQNRGKRLLAKAARRKCEEKGLNMYAPAQQSERQQKIQEALLNASFTAAQAVNAAGRR